MRLALLLMCCCATSQAALLDVQPLGVGYDFDSEILEFTEELPPDVEVYGLSQYWESSVGPVNVDYTLERAQFSASLTTHIAGAGDLSGFIDFTAPAARYELLASGFGLGSTKFYLDDNPLSVAHEVWTAPGQHRLSWQRERAAYEESAAVLVMQVPEPSGICLALAVPLLATLLLWRETASRAR